MKSVGLSHDQFGRDRVVISLFVLVSLTGSLFRPNYSCNSMVKFVALGTI